MYVRTHIRSTYVCVVERMYVRTYLFGASSDMPRTFPRSPFGSGMNFWASGFTYLSVSLDAESEKTYIRTYVLTYVLNLKGSRGGAVRTYVGGIIGWGVVGRAGPCHDTCQESNAAQKYDEGSYAGDFWRTPPAPSTPVPTYRAGRPVTYVRT